MDHELDYLREDSNVVPKRASTLQLQTENSRNKSRTSSAVGNALFVQQRRLSSDSFFHKPPAHLIRPKKVEPEWAVDEAERVLVDFNEFLESLDNDGLSSLFDVSPFRCSRLYYILHSEEYDPSKGSAALSPWAFAQLLQRLGVLDLQKFEDVSVQCPDAKDRSRWPFYHWCAARRRFETFDPVDCRKPVLPKTVPPAAEFLKPKMSSAAMLIAAQESRETTNYSIDGERTEHEVVVDWYWTGIQATGKTDEKALRNMVRSVYALWQAFVVPFLTDAEKHLIMLPVPKMGDVLRFVFLRGLLLARKRRGQASSRDSTGNLINAEQGFAVMDYTSDKFAETQVYPECNPKTGFAPSNVGQVEQRLDVKRVADFMMSPIPLFRSYSSKQMRWICYDLAKGRAGNATLLQLAVKYRIHPLAVEDALSIIEEAPSGRITKYGNAISDLVSTPAHKSLQAELQKTALTEAKQAVGAVVANGDEEQQGMNYTKNDNYPHDVDRGSPASHASIQSAESYFDPNNPLVPASSEDTSGEHWFLSIPLFRLEHNARHRVHSAIRALERIHGHQHPTIEAARSQARHGGTTEMKKSGSKEHRGHGGKMFATLRKAVSLSNLRHSVKEGEQVLDTGLIPNLGIAVESKKMGMVIGVKPEANFLLSLSTAWHPTRVNLCDAGVNEAMQLAQQNLEKYGKEGGQQAFLQRMPTDMVHLNEGDVGSILIRLSDDDSSGSESTNAGGQLDEQNQEQSYGNTKPLPRAVEVLEKMPEGVMEEVRITRQEQNQDDLQDEEDASLGENSSHVGGMGATEAGGIANMSADVGIIARSKNGGQVDPSSQELQNSGTADLGRAVPRMSQRKHLSDPSKTQLSSVLRHVKSLISKDSSMVRTGDAMWLVYAILDSSLDEMLPIAHAFELQLAITAARLHEHEHALPWNEVKNLYLIERHLDWFETQIKPMDRILKSLVTQENTVPPEVRGYLEDVQDTLNEWQERLNTFQRECESLKAERQAYVDASLNKLLTVLTIITAIALPATVASGYAGMNFVDEDGTPQDPLLEDEHGLRNYIIGVLLITVMLAGVIYWAARGIIQ
ncbi:unnamed protein product [Amoebophrya sp. A120]|nr:unnamed protein product [Amoebophrya sp. A120]|eukprot:GSA120T00016825001.1